MAEQGVKRVRTSTLLHRIFKAPNLEDFIKDNADAIKVPAFHTYISELSQEMNLVPERVIKQASIERTYGHQLFNGTRKPSRDKVIQLAFGFGLDVNGTQQLLKIAQKNLLYPRIKRDAAVLYCLSHHKNISETQNMLHDLQLTILGGSERND